MRTHALALFVAFTVATTCHAQKLVDEENWALEFELLKDGKSEGSLVHFDKLRVGGELIYFLPFELKNPGSSAREIQLQLFIITDIVASGVNPELVRDWNSFRKFQLPKMPANPTEDFDNTELIHRQLRTYDRPHAAALDAINRFVQEKRGVGPLRHLSSVTSLGPGESIQGVAIFRGVTVEMQHAGVVVKGLWNRIRDINKSMYMEDRVKIYRYWTPGSPADVDNNRIFFREFDDKYVFKREQISYPVE